MNISPESSQEFRGSVVRLSMEEYGGIRAFLSIPSDKPFLKVTEEPVEKFRFRYKSEMMGTHGSILARSHERNRRKIYPTVQLCNYKSPAVIRCSLYTAQMNEKLRTPHTHRLIMKAENNTDKDDPHDVIVSNDNNYTAIFHGMGIIHTAKKNIVEELIKKKQMRLFEKLQAKNINTVALSTSQMAELRQEAENEARKMNLNSVSLCFEAFIRDSYNRLHPICEPVFSKPINNMKSALTGELKICRIDKNTSSCLGGEEVFILVEKVGKKNIKIKFFEVDDDDTEIWCDYGKFSELDVHHQYAIVFRTPPYRDLEIDKTVDVFLQLYRPTDGDRSEPIKFQYKPSEKMTRNRKRQRLANESLNSGDKNTRTLNGYIDGYSNGLTNGSCNNNSVLNIDSVTVPSETFPSLDNLIEKLEIEDLRINSSEFRKFINNLSEDITQPLTHNGLGSVGSENLKMPVKYDVDFACTAAYSICTPSDFAFPGGLKTEGIVAREYFDLLNEDDLAQDGEHSATNREVTSQHNPKNSLEKKSESESDSDSISIKKESMGDINLLQKSLDELESTLSGKISQTALSEKVKEIFSVKNEEGENALHAAIMAGHKDILDLILQVLERGPHMSIINFQNLNAETPLHLAALYNQPEMVKMLICRGADPNIGNRYGNTALHVAVENGHNECLAELLEKKNYNNKSKVNCNLKNDKGVGPLHLSALKHNLFAVKHLVEAGADVKELDSTFGRHVLHIAAEQGAKDIVEYLVKETCVDVNLANYAGNTALHYACVVDGKGDADICKLLIEAGANPHLGNHEQRIKNDSLSFPEFLKVDVKEEIESEDDFQLRIADGGEEVEENDDNDDEDEEEEDDAKGQSSMDLAWNNKEILEILKKAEVTNAVLSENMTEVHIKKECVSPSGSISDNGLFDEETLGKLCSILDPSNIWINLVDLLDYTFLVPSIRDATSPTKLLFNYADLHGNVTVQNIRNFLEALDENEAVEAIDLMLARRISSNQ